MTKHLDETHVANLIKTIQTALLIDTSDGPKYVDTDASADAMSDLVDLFYDLVLTWNISDDERQAAIEAVIKAARTMVPHRTPVGYLLTHAKFAAKLQASTEGGVRVNPRVRSRLLTILSHHDGNHNSAYHHIVTHPDDFPGLSPATAAAGLRALHTVADVSHHDLPHNGHEHAVINDHLVHQTLLPELTDRQRETVLMYYGFTKSVPANLAYNLAEHGFSTGDQLTEAAISGIHGTTRQAVHRRRVRAINTMRRIIEQEPNV